MSVLSSLGLGELSSRPKGQRRTFFFLIAISAFLFMDQNLMAPNLAAIGEELVVTREKVRAELSASDPDFAADEARLSAEQARAEELARRVQGLRANLKEQDPVSLEAALVQATGGSLSASELSFLRESSELRASIDARVSERVQREIDDRLAGRASVGFWMLGGLMALIAGYLTDKGPRKRLLAVVVLIGALPCLFTAWAQDVDQFVILRALTGIGIGAVLPLTYSLLGDLFSSKSRPAAAAWVGLASGIGIAGGQLMAGLLGPTYGWRLPFILVAVPNLVLAVLLLLFAEEPRRGGAEVALQGSEYEEKLRLSDLKKLFANKTNLLVFAQGIPGSMPWGFFFTFLVDFYHSNKGFSVEAATLLITVFGAGAILGSFVGGLLGGKLYRKKAAYLPMLCAVAIFLGIPPILAIVNWAPASEAPLLDALYRILGAAKPPDSIAGPALLGVLGAFLATMTASNVKAVLIDVNPPENRGTIFSLFNLADDLGKGLAPFLIGSILAVHFGRTVSFNIAVLMWILCGLAWIGIVFTFPKDVAALEARLAGRGASPGEAVPTSSAA